MKEWILTISIILIATHATSQVRTGGGGGPDLDTPDRRVIADKMEARLNQIFQDLSKELIKIEKKCTGRNSFPVDYNFIDSFHSLSLKKPMELTGPCEPTEEISRCLDTKKLKSIMEDVNQIPGSIMYNYLNKKYKLDAETGKIILNFYHRK